MTAFVAVTSLWVTAKVAAVAPLRTLTDAGTVRTAASELLRVTVAPAVAALVFRVTWPVTVTLEPPTSELCETDTP